MAPPLRAGEEEWQTVFERLRERFPTVGPEKVAEILREHEGHAGNAAAVLREASSSNVKEPDADDVEHVSTLLSSPAMFKHACKEQFALFDCDGNGVLDVNEVIALTNNLYANFGLQTPSEGSVRAFFVATDQNGDGVLSEREFRRFFEMFLRFAYFDVAKLRELVEKGNQKAGGSAMPAQAPAVPTRPQRSSPTADRSSSCPMPVKPHAPDSPKRRDRSQHRSHKSRERELEDGGTSRSHRSHKQCELEDGGTSRSHRSQKHREFEDGGTSRSHRSHKPRDLEDGGTSRSHRSQKHRSSLRHEGPVPHGACGSVRCVAPHGVAYRRTVDYEDRRSDAVCHKGDRVQILEHWVRTSEGWLPLVDLQGADLFHFEEDGASRKAKVRIEDRQRSQSLEDVRPSSDEGHELDASELHEDEAEWKDRLERLCERFPKVPRATILQGFRDHDGHAGLVATMCRELQAQL